jgi:hypothetical protein
MNNFEKVSSKEFESFTIKVHEPFAEFLMADEDEYAYEISLLDVVHFAGHACPAMVGAFLICQRATKELFPETNICVRGQVSIEIPTSVTHGATGPISNVFSMIFGAWDKSGFGGLQGQFVRRGLLKYDSQLVSPGTFRFRNLKTGDIVDVSYDPSTVKVPDEVASLPFQKVWRYKIATILKSPADYIQSHRANSG